MQITYALSMGTPAALRFSAQEPSPTPVQYAPQGPAQDTFQRRTTSVRFGANTPEPEPRVTTVMHQAVEAGNLEQLHWLLHERHELLERKDEDGQTPLHLAAFMNDGRAVKMLLHHRADIHATDDNGQGIVHMTSLAAAGNGHLGLLRFFLNLGLDAADPDDDGTTPREALNFLPEEEGFDIAPVARLLRAYGG